MYYVQNGANINNSIEIMASSAQVELRLRLGLWLRLTKNVDEKKGVCILLCFIFYPHSKFKSRNL